MKQGSRHFDYALLFVIALIWSSSFLAIKIGVESLPPYTLTATRLLIAAVVLFLFALVGRYQLPRDLRSWGIFALIGMFGNALPFSLISWGETYVDSGLAAILMGIMPVATAMLAHLFIPDERFTFSIGLGMAVGFGGLLVLVGIDALGGMTHLVIAQLAILTGAVSYAVTTIFARRYASLPGPIMALGATLSGFLLVLPLSVWIDRPWTLSPSAASTTAAVWLGLFPTAIATLLYFRLILRLGATIFSQVNYLIPVLGAIWGILFLAETPTWRTAVALLLVLAGVTIVNRSR